MYQNSFSKKKEQEFPHLTFTHALEVQKELPPRKRTKNKYFQIPFTLQNFFSYILFCFIITDVLLAQQSRKCTDEDLIKLISYWTFIRFSPSHFPRPLYYLIIPLGKLIKQVPFSHFMHEETELKRLKIVPWVTQLLTKQSQNSDLSPMPKALLLFHRSSLSCEQKRRLQTPNPVFSLCHADSLQC